MTEKKQNIDEHAADNIRRLTQIGMALSAEKDINRLMEKILNEARVLTNADGGTLYLLSQAEDELQFAFVQNESLGISMGGTKGETTWPPIKLTGTDGLPNHDNVSAHVAITGEPVNIADVYDAPGFNFEGPRAYDQERGYRTQSMLVVPMRDHNSEIIGVLQLLNATDPSTGRLLSFSQPSQELASSAIRK